LADKDKVARKLFGVPGNLFGLIPGRVTYIIGIDGIVKGIYNSQTNPLGHIEKALELVKDS
jgi:peroxiredoxin Q/BCP